VVVEAGAEVVVEVVLVQEIAAPNNNDVTTKAISKIDNFFTGFFSFADVKCHLYIFATLHVSPSF
jgi:hypothetical protein